MTGGSGSFLRVERPELQDGRLVVRAVPPDELARRRTSSSTPLGYLYARHEGLPDADLTMTAGRYDEEGLVWRWTGELTGLIGLTEASSDDDRHRTDSEGSDD